MKKIILTLSLSSFLGLSNAAAQVGIGTNTPNASAVLELQSTNKGFLPPRMTSAQRDLIATPVEGLVIYNISNNCLEFFDGSNWINFCDGPPPISVVSGGGREWMDRNLGATQVATSSTDADSYGDLYQWGRAADGHQLRSNVCPTNCFDGNPAPAGVPNFNNDQSNPWYGKFITVQSTNNWLEPTVANLNDLWQDLNGVNNPCPTGFRLPTIAEWDIEIASWSPVNASGAMSSPLKLPYTGYRNQNDGLIIENGTSGTYWSSTANNDQSARGVYMASNFAFTDPFFKAHGFAIRCIKHQ